MRSLVRLGVPLALAAAAVAAAPKASAAAVPPVPPVAGDVLDTALVTNLTGDQQVQRGECTTFTATLQAADPDTGELAPVHTAWQASLTGAAVGDGEVVDQQTVTADPATGVASACVRVNFSTSYAWQFDGDDTYASASSADVTFQVPDVATTMTVAQQGDVHVGQLFEVWVDLATPLGPAIGREVTLTCPDGAGEITTATTSDTGRAVLTITPDTADALGGTCTYSSPGRRSELAVSQEATFQLSSGTETLLDTASTTVTAGKPVTIVAHVQRTTSAEPVPGLPAQLRSQVDRGALEWADEATTDADGVVRFTVTPTVTTNYRVEASGKEPGPDSSVSSFITIAVAPTVTVGSLTPAKPVARKAVTVRGATSASPGDVVQLLVLGKVVRTAKVSAVGRWAFRIAFGRAGRYRIAVRVLATASHAAATSAARTVVVR